MSTSPNLLKVRIPPKPAHSYPIVIGQGILQHPQKWLPKTFISRCVVISDAKVYDHYGPLLKKALQKQGIDPLTLTFKPGESSKSYSVKQQLEDKMFQQGCDRDSLILALGGGVTGDLAGFIAATYMRGIRYIQIPTSLMAMIDSSVGGKTAINHPQYGKNLIGAFLQPEAVISDIECLRTLPKIHRLNGLVEAIKIFISHDQQSFARLQAYKPSKLLGDDTLLTEVIVKAVSIKMCIVERDQEERNGERAVCNFGHTIAHAIEQLSDYQMLHGHAVALGLLVETRIAQLMQALPESDCLAIERFLARLGFTGKKLDHFDVDEVITLTKFDKKTKLNQAHYVLLKKIGDILKTQDGKYTHPIQDTIVKSAFLKVNKGTLHVR